MQPREWQRDGRYAAHKHVSLIKTRKHGEVVYDAIPKELIPYWYRQRQARLPHTQTVYNDPQTERFDEQEFWNENDGMIDDIDCRYTRTEEIITNAETRRCREDVPTLPRYED